MSFGGKLLLCAAGCLALVSAQTAQAQECQNCNQTSQYCNGCDDCDEFAGVKKYSKEWFELHASLPIGARQRYKHGKLWPPYPRPTGPSALVIHRYHAAHYWPHPYDCWDRAATRSFIEQNVSNGWQNATTLFDYHFDAESNKLTEAGVMHLQWILESTPGQYRTAYVQTSAAEGANEARLSSVQEIAMRLAGDSSVPAVRLRNARPTGRPASEIVQLRRAEMQSIPDPRLPLNLNSGPETGQ